METDKVVQEKGVVQREVRMVDVGICQWFPFGKVEMAICARPGTLSFVPVRTEHP